jgi:hypothetical protein
MNRQGFAVWAVLGAIMMLGLLGPGCSDTDPPLCDGGNCLPVDGLDGTDNTCPVLCSVDTDCCDGQSCKDGVCVTAGLCPGGCNHECGARADGLICDQGASPKKCIQGAPPLNCQSDCNCFAGEVCDNGACVAACTGDEDCPADMQCRDQRCRPKACQTREDCAGAGCLVCRNQACVPEPAVCAGDGDCCVGRRCNFGTCIDEITGCTDDNYCQQRDPDLPRCVDGQCVPECLTAIDCPVGKNCIDNHCVASGCTPQTCPQGQWCNTGTGECLPGCDSNDDCTPPQTCDYTTHQCGQTDCCGNSCTAGSQYCDSFTCQCVELCANEPGCRLNNPPNCCPSNYTCNTQTGRCICTAAACPAGSTCDTNAASPTYGSCVAIQGDCNPPCTAPMVCSPTNTCVMPGGGLDGAPCFMDAECDAAQGFLCDGSIFCILCMILDPTFEPEFVCRAQCQMLGSCSNPSYNCKYRHTGLIFLCTPW